MNRLALMTWAALSLATWALPAAAENAAKVHLTAFKVTSVQAGPASREKLESLQGLRPGDTIEYRAVYVNTTDKPATNVQITLPVPAGGLQYLPDSAAPRATSASTDGVRFDPVPLMRAERLADGSTAMRKVPAADYRFLRWHVGDVAQGASRDARARMHFPATTSVDLASASVR